jgi:dolichyl-diphosphooligosaccharide--protein glycosyltransferase
MDDEGSVREILQERPDLASPLEVILEVDEHNEQWTFDDVPIESGPFGELVSRDVVVSEGDAYRLANPDGVRSALTHTEDSDTDAASSLSLTDRLDATLKRPTRVNPTLVLATAALVSVALVRLIPLLDVYRDGDIVLSGNDPYYYRFLVEQLLTHGSFPEWVRTGEPLLVWVLAAFSALFGGTATAAGHVLAWYPVAAAVIAAIFVFLVAKAVTDDVRIAIGAVLIFAVLPGHAMRTSFGFADHHAFDYVWLVITALAIVKLATVDSDDLRSRNTAVYTGIGAAAIAGQVLAWNAAPLLLVPLALIVPLRASLDVVKGVSPVPAGIPVIGALGLGALLAGIIHLITGMQTVVAVIAPVGIAAWAAITLLIATVAHRYDRDIPSVLGGYSVVILLGVIALANAPAAIRDRAISRMLTLFRGGQIFEVQSLFSPTSLGSFVQFGLVLLLALPAMALAIGYSLTDDKWLVLATYGWVFLLFAALQARFAGELSAFVAIFAAYGFVTAAARSGDIPSPGRVGGSTEGFRLPGRRTTAVVLVVVLIIGGAGVYQSNDMMGRVGVEDSLYQSASFLSDHSASQDLDYPDNYVLSNWPTNRVYNYFVNGVSYNYSYARANYTNFAGSTTPDEWYDRLEDRVGYVGFVRAVSNANPRSTIYRITRNEGSATEDVPGVGHYRLLYRSADGRRTAVSVVPGARLTGTGDSGETVALSTTVDATGVSFSYRRNAAVGPDGRWNVTLAHPGDYEVRIGDTSEQITIDETAVRSGANLTTNR